VIHPICLNQSETVLVVKILEFLRQLYTGFVYVERIFAASVGCALEELPACFASNRHKRHLIFHQWMLVDEASILHLCFSLEHNNKSFSFSDLFIYWIQSEWPEKGWLHCLFPICIYLALTFLLMAESQ